MAKTSLIPVMIAVFSLFTHSANAADLKAFFSRPLIIGASVSADYAAKSPGKILAERYTEPGAIRVMAIPGREGKQLVRSITPEYLKRFSSVIGIDLFFWDSVKGDCDDGVKAAQNFIQQNATAKVPLVIGTIPSVHGNAVPLLASWISSGCRQLLNQAIRSTCDLKKDCHVFPLDRIYGKLSDDGRVFFESRYYSKDDLLTDGVHPNETGSRYLAAEMLKLLNK